jgi:sporulation protein YlmC with PRC-barrel domain
MQRNVNSLIGFTIGATDGEIGKVEEFYFDDETWTLRYLIVKTGGWLLGRKVLISPTALLSPDWEHHTFPARLTQEEVKHSPDIDTDKPVSRQHELELYNHYSWPYEVPVGVGFYGGLGMMGMADSRIPFEEQIAAQQPQQHKGDPHLRSTKEVKGYTLHALDGEIGEVEDFIVDDTNWTIRFLVVDTGKWLPGKKVLIAPTWITKIQWETSTVEIDLNVETVKDSPEYDPGKPLPETYERHLYIYYGRTIKE